MKIIIIIIFFFLIPNVHLNAQEIIRKNTEEEISKKLVFNMKEGILKDSVALYTFAIIVKGNKKDTLYTITEIKSNDSLCYKLFPEIDSILKDINFGVFVDKQGFCQIIIPVAIVLTGHDYMPKNSNINIWDIPKRLNALLDKDDNLKYQSIYLNPRTIMVDNQVYN